MSILDTVVARSTLGEHDGRSGASLERVVLADGRRLVVKRSRWATDVVRRLTDDVHGREGALWRAGVLDRVGARHAIVDAYDDGDESVVVMRDLGDAVFGWHRVLTPDEVSRLLAGMAAVHASGVRSDLLVPLDLRARLLHPGRIEPLAAEFPLAAAVLEGWRRFDELVDASVAADIAALRGDPSRLVTALANRRCTLIHGDCWPVNAAFLPDGVVLLDWGLATWAPPALDLVSFLAGAAAAHMAVSREEAIAEFGHLAGDRHDDVALRLAFTLGLLDFGWNKALDAATAPTAAERARHRADLDWWVAAALDPLRAGLI
jgi:hypothetical protein